MESLSQYGIFSFLKTDNKFVNLLIAILLPMIINYLSGFNYDISHLIRKIKKKDGYVYKYIIDDYVVNDNGVYVPKYRDKRNDILQKIIRMYVCSKSCIEKNITEYIYDDNILKINYYQETDVWKNITRDIQLKHTHSTVYNQKNSELCVEYILRTRVSEKHLEKFISEAEEWYENTNKPEYNKIYIYIPIPNCKDNNNDDNENRVTYNKYELDENKTFDSIFFPKKIEVIQQIDNFMNKTGKYSIKGYNNKLGFLLHGPPGTGKTSFIKALANYTKRHIIIISLSKIKTNQVLFKMMFELSFYVKNQDKKTNFKFKDVIFVFEDVDVVLDVINERSEVNDIILDSVKNTKKGKDSTDILKKITADSDNLDLAGILNALDGVVDSPDRIIIMSTNCPEKIDSALKRPGRIDKIIHLDYILYEEAVQMIEKYYCCALENDKIECLKKIFENNKITPAKVEQMCNEYENIEEFINSLNN